MEIEIIKSKLKYSLDYHEVGVEINGKKLIMDVTVNGRAVEEHIESSKTDLWNTLKYEEKLAIEDALNNYF